MLNLQVLKFDPSVLDFFPLLDSVSPVWVGQSENYYFFDFSNFIPIELYCK